jgi:predicted GTPase
MHWSYTRFLQNRLRESYDLEGVPVIIEYKSKYGNKGNPYDPK